MTLIEKPKNLVKIFNKFYLILFFFSEKQNNVIRNYWEMNNDLNFYLVYVLLINFKIFLREKN